MARPPMVPVEVKLRIVLSVLTGEMTVSEASRRNKVSEQSIHRWKSQFVEGGKIGLADGGKVGMENPRERALLGRTKLTRPTLDTHSGR